jgi:hypothetical protein
MSMSDRQPIAPATAEPRGAGRARGHMEWNGRSSDGSFEGHCCICAEGVVDEYQSGGCRHAEGRENSSKLPIEHVT